MNEYLTAHIPDVDAYLERIGVERQEELNLEYLDKLVCGHLMNVPFENLNLIRLHKPISLGIEDLYQKIVVEKRGGYCFEMNGLFTRLLQDLGFDAWSVRARVGRPDPNLWSPCTHRGVIVRLPEGLHYCDVGFGGPMPAGAIRVEDGADKYALSEHYRIRRFDDYWWVLKRVTETADPETGALVEEESNVVRFYLMPQENDDFLVPSYFCSANPESVFCKTYFLNRRVPGGHVSLMDDTLTIARDGEKEIIKVPQNQMDQVLEEHFGLVL